MPRFSEVVLLLVSFTLLPSLIVNGFQELSRTVNYKYTRRDAVIRGLLFSRDCSPGLNVCEIVGCCPASWECCAGSSYPSTILSFSSSIADLNFLRFHMLSAWASLSNWLQVTMVWSIRGYRTNCELASNGLIGCCPNGELCTGPAEFPSIVGTLSPTFVSRPPLTSGPGGLGPLTTSSTTTAVSESTNTMLVYLFFLFCLSCSAIQ